MNKKVASILNKKEINCLVEAKHGDVFAVLGQHSSSKGLVIRALLPDAKAVVVIDAKTKKTLLTLNSIHDAGLFEGVIEQQRDAINYKFLVSYDNDTVEMFDPYSFSSCISSDDLYLFCEGTHEKNYQWMGAHKQTLNGVEGISFVVWAPDASRVSLIGEFNRWDGRCHVMRKHPSAGVWEIFIPELAQHQCYKYEILSHQGQLLPLKADPYAFYMQQAPDTSSLTVHSQAFDWSDDNWMEKRAKDSNHYNGAVSIYEVHLGSWRRNTSDDDDSHGRYLTYDELAVELIDYVLDMGFTHIQLMPISEYPFDGSWGYQPIGLFAPTSRFGSPEGFKHFINSCHNAGIGVLLDWVPGHFPTDDYGLGRFDGTCLYEHEDTRKGFHPDWNTLIYNYGRNEVKSFLLSNAMYWLANFHIDGLRVDAVASMLYLDYSRNEGEWEANIYGGRENLEAIEMLKQVNSRVYFNNPGAMMIAEESTAWPGVSKPVDAGGLGFGFKWNMGWMNDTLGYMERDPIHRKFHHNEMTFGLIYSFSENFVLPLSHDEVVHGKGSLIEKMPGDDWQKFANLRAYLGFMWTHPGKKLLFMGGEFAQRDEWDHNKSLDWHLLQSPSHQGMQQLVKDLNHVYKSTPALYQLDCDSSGFEWVLSENQEQSIFAYVRHGLEGSKPALVVVNMTPSSYQHYKMGVPFNGQYREILNSDRHMYGGSGMQNTESITSVCEEYHGQPYQIDIVIPPLATVIFQLD